jgi:hypothetical protein
MRVLCCTLLRVLLLAAAIRAQHSLPCPACLPAPLASCLPCLQLPSLPAPPGCLAAAFYGVDRGQDPDRLAGTYHDGSSDPIEEALVDIASKCAERGGSPSKIFTSYASSDAFFWKE